MASQPLNRQSATIVHLALLLGPLLFIGVAAWLRLGPGASPATVANGEVLGIACYAVAATTYLLAVMLRGRIPVREVGEDESAWWAIHQTRAILLWALIEGPMLFAGVVFLLTGDLALLGAVAGAGVVLMVYTAPGRLTGG